MEKMERHPYRWLGLLGLIVFLAGNMYLAITDTAESNYALTAKEMVLAHNWLSPQIYGHYWYDKPIFFYWELMLSYSLFGFTEFASRLPSALFGTLGVLFTYWFTQRIYDKKVGLMAALILMTSVECWIISKAVVTDATLFLFMSGSIAFFYLGYHENRRWYYLCYVAAALAVLTKGPIGLLLPGLGATVFLILKHDVKEFLKVHLFSGFVLCIVICMSWYGWMYAVHGSDFVLNFFGVHNYLRATVSEHASKNVWYFYIIVFFVGFMPWSFTWPVLLWKKYKTHTWPWDQQDDAVLLLGCYAVVTFLFFSVVATKYTTYTYPMLFSLSFLTALLFRDFHITCQKPAFIAMFVYVVLAFAVAPSIMLQHSGKEVGLALANTNTEGKCIGYYTDYSTGAVFYSGKTIYRIVDDASIDKMKPGKLNWNAKNVMPMMTKDEFIHQKEGVIAISRPQDQTFFMDYTDEMGTQHIPSYRAGRMELWMTPKQN